MDAGRRIWTRTSFDPGRETSLRKVKVNGLTIPSQNWLDRFMGNCSRNPPLQTKLETRVLELGLQTDMREGVKQGDFPEFSTLTLVSSFIGVRLEVEVAPAVGNRE